MILAGILISDVNFIAPGKKNAIRIAAVITNTKIAKKNDNPVSVDDGSEFFNTD